MQIKEYMSFLNLARRRFSARLFMDRPVEYDNLEIILEAGRIAPSAKNIQPWHFIVLRDKEKIKKISECYDREWLHNAPVIIVICGDHTVSWKRPDGKDHCDIDIAIAVDHITLAATELGLGTCWICKFNEKRCAELLKLPEGIEPIVILPVGYPVHEGDPDRHYILRKPFKDIVHWDSFDIKKRNI
jgi:nitroreductase